MLSRVKLWHVVVAVLLAVVAFTRWELSRERKYSHHVETERDSIQAEEFKAHREAAGWATHFGVQNPKQLDSLLNEWDSTYSADAKRSHVQVTALVQLVAELRGHVESKGVVDSAGSQPAGSPQTPANAPTEQPRPIQALGRVDDGLLSGSWSFRYTDALLSLDYTASPELQLVEAAAGDGRTIITARGTDPRVHAIVQQLIVDPVRIEVRSCSWKERGAWLGSGTLAGLLWH